MAYAHVAHDCRLGSHIMMANAVNFVYGLDGLAAGVVFLGAAAFFTYSYGLTVGLSLNRATTATLVTAIMAGACLGFLPHNFKPATIFLGDCGSLLLGYCTIVNVLLLGDTGKTPLVLAGMVIYAIPIIDTVLAENRAVLMEHEAKAVLAAYGVPVVSTRVAHDIAGLRSLASELGFPLVLKILSPDITHKSDVGGVVLNIGNHEELEAALPHARSEWLHTTGQLPHLTHPHRLSKLVREFIVQ